MANRKWLILLFFLLWQISAPAQNTDKFRVVILKANLGSETVTYETDSIRYDFEKADVVNFLTHKVQTSHRGRDSTLLHYLLTTKKRNIYVDGKLDVSTKPDKRLLSDKQDLYYDDIADIAPYLIMEGKATVYVKSTKHYLSSVKFTRTSDGDFVGWKEMITLYYMDERKLDYWVNRKF